MPAVLLVKLFDELEWVTEGFDKSFIGIAELLVRDRLPMLITLPIGHEGYLTWLLIINPDLFGYEALLLT